MTEKQWTGLRDVANSAKRMGEAIDVSTITIKDVRKAFQKLEEAQQKIVFWYPVPVWVLKRRWLIWWYFMIRHVIFWHLIRLELL